MKFRKNIGTNVWCENDYISQEINRQNEFVGK